MIVWIASYPRSGNTFFRMLLHRFLGINTYSVYKDLRLNVDVVGEASLDRPLPELDASKRLYFVKTHEQPGADSYPAVYIIRDGRDALVSHAHHLIHYRRTRLEAGDTPQASHGKVLHRLIAHQPLFGGWSANVEAWSRRAARTHVIRFEDLIRNPQQVFRQTMAALNCHLPCDESAGIPGFAWLHATEPGMFREGKTGGWKREMPPGLAALFQQMHGPTLQRLGYVRGPAPRGRTAWLLERNSQPDLARTEDVQGLYAARPPRNGVFVGDGWHPFEDYVGQQFRWAGDNAEIVLTAPDAPRTLKMEVDPGPSCGGRPLEFEVRDARGNTLFAQTVPWRQTLPIPLPTLPKRGTTLRLVSRNGGRRVADGRVLNFRAFAIELVPPSGARPA